VNRHLKERVLYSNKNLIGERCNLVYCNRKKTPDDCPALITFRTGKPERQEHPIDHPDGSTRHYYFTCAPIRDAEGKVVSVLELVQDMTDRHVMEKTLKEKNIELAQFNKAMVGRELKMIELKEKIKELEKALAEKGFES